MKKFKSQKLVSPLLSIILVLSFLVLGAGSGKNSKAPDDSIGKQPAETIGNTENFVDKITFFNEDGEIITYRKYYYNEKGLLREEKIYTDEDDFLSKIVYEYDENGALLNNKQIDYNGNVLASEVFEYDEYGVSKKNTLVREYDSNRNIIKETDYHDNGNVKTIKEFEYDANGNVIKETYYSYAKDYNKNFADPVVPRITLYTYSADGKLSERRLYHDTGKVNGDNTVYEYGADGKLIKKSKYNCYSDQDIIDEHYEFEYNTSGKLIHAVMYDYEYDSETGIRTPELLNEYTYTYDNNGNLINYTEYLGDYNGETTTEVKIDYADTFISSPADNNLIAENQKKIVDVFTTPAVLDIY